jgi:transcription antitermination factor NusG
MEKWYTLCTRANCEKKVVALLKKKNIEAYCPMRKTQAHWSFRKYDFKPVFPNYVFVKISDQQQAEVRNLSGVVNFMYWHGTPAVVKDREIDLMKKFLESHENIRVERVPVNKYLIKVSNSTLEERGGTLIATPTRTVKASLPSIGYMISAEVKEEVAETDNVTYIYPYFKYIDAI